MNPIDSSSTSRPTWVRLDEFVAAYESAWDAAGHANIRQFLPESTHALYDQVLRELLRVELELGWQAGLKPRLDSFRSEFPNLFRDKLALTEVAFEEYRQRLQAGERPSPDEYALRYGINTSGWKPASRTDDELDDRESSATDGRLRNLVRGTFVTDGSMLRSADHPHLHSPGQQLAHAALSYQALRLGNHEGTANLNSWCSQYTGPADHARFFRELHESCPERAELLAKALVSFPAVGSEFLGFQLLQELGRGAFGRVYLAVQPELANRFVALKIATDIFGESQTLAQLQHTNIVPIYSVHKASPFQAVCMPYFGAATLADLLVALRSEGQLPGSGKVLISTLNDRKQSTRRSNRPSIPKLPTSPAFVGEGDAKGALPTATASLATLQQFEHQKYVDVVLWLGIRLADGLAHAHERGIQHRDLKPANVLLTDDGQPMLLDFNLAQDTKQSQAAASIGGTLPYMAPEHLRAFQGQKVEVDARSDIYSLAVILFELLTGRHPFKEQEALQGHLEMMIAARMSAPPFIRIWNHDVSPSFEAILRKCLEADPAHRYQTARQLLGDLERQKDDLPLKHAREPSIRERVGKWSRRHPRVTSARNMFLVTGLLLAVGASGYGFLWHQNKRYESLQSVDRLEESLRHSQALLYGTQPELEDLQEGIAKCMEAIKNYQVADDSSWRDSNLVRYLNSQERQRLEGDLGELFYLLAHASNLQARRERDAQSRQAGVQLALDFNRQAETQFSSERLSPAFWQQRAELAELLGDLAQARESRERAGELKPQSIRDRYLLAHQFARVRDFNRALQLLREATREDPKNFSAWLVQGNCHDTLGQHGEALASYSACIALRPNYYGSWHNRGLILLKLHQFDWAKADFDQAIKLRPDLPDPYINRAVTYQAMAKYPEALADFDSALNHGTERTRVYFHRSRLKARAGDKAGADKDFEEGMRHEPQDEKSWIARGLARVDKDPKGALADFDEALRLNSRSIDALQNKANALSESLGRTAEALAVLDQSIKVAPDFVPAIAGRGVLRARLGQLEGALEDAREALARDTQSPNLYQVAGIYALRSKKYPEDRLKALELLGSALRSGFGVDWVDQDSELDPIRKDSEFIRLVTAAKALQEKKPKR